MKVLLHKNFEKRYAKLRPAEKERFKARRNLFLSDPFHSLLNNHGLEGKHQSFRSINVGGDLRVIYKLLDKDVVLFVTIDTHSNLYKF